MSNNHDKKLTDAQLEQLRQLQKIMMQQGENDNKQTGQEQGFWTKILKQLSPKYLLMLIIQFMQNSVKFVDQLITLIAKPNSDTINDVVRNARSPILFGVFILVFFVLFGGLWTFFAPLDSAAVAIGTVVSSSQKKVLNNQEGGIIKAIHVKIGDKVKQGESLIELDDVKIKSEYESVLHQYRMFAASEARLLAEINRDSQISWPQFLIDSQQQQDVSKIILTQTNLFESRKSLESAERDSLKQKLKQLDKQIEGYNAKKQALNKTFDVIRERVLAARQLNDKGVVQKSVLGELEVKMANVQSEIAITDTEVARSQQEIIKTEIDLLNLDSKFSTQALSELKEVQANLTVQRERFIYLTSAIERIVIKSPVDGVVNQLYFYTLGSTIPPGQPIIEISPNNDLLVIDARIDPKNIDAIRVGLTSKVRFSAFKSRTTPLFSGKVVSLSPDVIVDHHRGSGDPQSAGGYYLARIELDMDEFHKIADSRKLKLQPGMQAEVQIVTGTRTLLRYLLDPVYDAMFKGFKEK